MWLHMGTCYPGPPQGGVQNIVPDLLSDTLYDGVCPLPLTLPPLLLLLLSAFPLLLLSASPPRCCCCLLI